MLLSRRESGRQHTQRSPTRVSVDKPPFRCEFGGSFSLFRATVGLNMFTPNAVSDHRCLGPTCRIVTASKAAFQKPYPYQVEVNKAVRLGGQRRGCERLVVHRVHIFYHIMPSYLHVHPKYVGISHQVFRPRYYYARPSSKLAGCICGAGMRPCQCPWGKRGNGRCTDQETLRACA